jgi:hypothetical protein
MSEIQEIDVFVQADGSVRLEVRGVRGPVCRELTEELERLLGGSVVERIHTDEFSAVADELEEEQQQSARALVTRGSD